MTATMASETPEDRTNKLTDYQQGYKDAVEGDRAEWAHILRLSVAGKMITEDQALNLYAQKYGVYETEQEFGRGPDA